MTEEVKSVPSISVSYARNGKATKVNVLGMRPMQERAYERRGEQYLLIKSPPASGKSRALMFIALDKLLNQGIKRFFRRKRPTISGDKRFAVRTPRTSSFPSGHASSAFFAALLLTHWVHGWQIGLFYLFAVIIAFSRVGVRIHHASDVLAGALTGTLMGAIGLIALASL